MRKTIWLLSAYRADSHAAWADWLVETLTEFDWRRFELPGRHFAWRIRGNPLSWLDALAEGPNPDLVLATSMVDLATLRGLHPRLAQVPTALYFHENQFVYPTRDRQLTSLEARMVQVYAALAADRVLFNSAYNRASFLDGVEGLLKQMPDHVPAGVVERIENRAETLPVPIQPIAPSAERDAGLIVWNHRWEHDRQPEQFADAMIALRRAGIDFRMALLGARPETVPDALGRLRSVLGESIVADGFLVRDEYRKLLARAGIVVSTSLHEFQGLSVLEAISAGCVPLVPDALVYPEIVDAGFRYPANDVDGLVGRLARWRTEGAPSPPDVSAWFADTLRPRWRARLASWFRVCGRERKR